jgi:GIY-YIG catalytic domain
VVGDMLDLAAALRHTWAVREHLYYAYILASRRNGTLYVGVTNNVMRRTWEHKQELVEGFMKKYGVHILVWYEAHENTILRLHGRNVSSAGTARGRSDSSNRTIPDGTICTTG